MLLRGYPIQSIIYLIPVILVSITIHEFVHGYISLKLGDPTAKNQGRLTLNPLKHIDLLGGLMFLLVGFGWAKPVSINATYYKNRKKGLVLTSIAGPLSNILMAFLFSIPMYVVATKAGIYADQVFKSLFTMYIKGFNLYAIIFNISRTFYQINIVFAIFNLIPVPPLDGSRLLSVVLPQKYYFKVLQYENIIVIILMVLIFVFPNVIFGIMSPLIWVAETAIEFIVKGVSLIF